MSGAHRPRRSVLYMPGSNARALEKAQTLAADALVIDLEDAVAVEAKELAREQACAAVRDRRFGKREVIVRVNSLDSPWGLDDVRAVSDAAPDAILVPKIDDPQSLKRFEALMNDHGAGPDVAVWAMMETARAILNAQQIAATAVEPGSRLTAWVVGTHDLAKDLKCAIKPGREALLTSLSLCVVAARAYGIAIIDSIYTGIKDRTGFMEECEQGAAMGFDGKTLIHPSQIDPCNRIFAPSKNDIAWARKVIAAFELPENRNKGAIQLDGKMVERLHAEQAERLVAIADTIAELAAAE
ncbi:MAG: CoA ester lyase [Alphaproteobacteria bacterium]|nr:MAG: CoA ester lyase [Alphaproteobacteria bacterium]